MRKAVWVTAILLIFIATVSSASTAQPMPSIPQFTVQFIDESYTIQANTTIDPSTGKTVTNPSQYINNKTIQISIKYESKAVAFQQYDIRLKNHNAQEWTNISSIRADPQAEYAVLTFAIAGNNATGNFTNHIDTVTAGDKVDFQVLDELWIQRISGEEGDYFHWQRDYVLYKESDWSPTQTVTIIESSVPEFSVPLTITVLIMVTVALAAVVKRRKKV